MQDLLVFYIVFNLVKNDNISQNNLFDPKPIINIDTVNFNFDANSILITDLNNKIYFKKNILQKLPIASLTKIMSAIIVLENINLNTYITIKNRPKDIDGYVPTLPLGEVFTVHDLLVMSLISSDNDAIYSIADYYGYDKFIHLMNKKARELKMYNTNFTNPVGYDDDKHYSNAIDMLVLTKYALKYDFFKKIVNTDKYSIKSKSNNLYKGTNTNKLLTINDIKNFIFGIKTGTTQNAKECLIFLYKKNNIDIIGIIIGSTDRYNDALKAINLIHSKI